MWCRGSWLVFIILLVSINSSLRLSRLGHASQRRMWNSDINRTSSHPHWSLDIFQTLTTFPNWRQPFQNTAAAIHWRKSATFAGPTIIHFAEHRQQFAGNQQSSTNVGNTFSCIGNLRRLLEKNFRASSILSQTDCRFFQSMEITYPEMSMLCRTSAILCRNYIVLFQPWKRSENPRKPSPNWRKPLPNVGNFFR